MTSLTRPFFALNGDAKQIKLKNSTKTLLLTKPKIKFINFITKHIRSHFAYSSVPLLSNQTNNYPPLFIQLIADRFI